MRPRTRWLTVASLSCGCRLKAKKHSMRWTVFVDRSKSGGCDRKHAFLGDLAEAWVERANTGRSVW